ncbi:hypothetical protein TSAR_005253 [Trichomalopsis sarcophagae]|uniref:Uncharacterized protein n=1 Tax=Trichomalopsis sarcophagae TaxID=543379 RepID=A0A232F7H9_9HYME|nr:hypothetical protein TSAR_005253 [Trichomalopsis sarcophagae]
MTGKSLFATLTLLCVSGLWTSTSAKGTKIDVSRVDKERKPRFISFDTNSGKIDINLDLSVPFLSIPLEDKKEHGGPPMPLLNVNTKALTVFGLLMALSAFVVPLFVKKIPDQPPNVSPAELHHHHYSKEHKRSDRGSDLGSDLWYFGDSLNEILFKDSRVTPCVQRIICTAVAAASHSDNPSSADKIIDGLSSNRWFEQAANGTVIKEAVSRGRQVLAPDECIETYKGCVLNQQIIANALKIVGV